MEQSPILIDVNEEVLFLRHVVEDLWDRGDGVIIGRGSQKILAEKPNTLYVRFIGAIGDRCKHVMLDEGMSYETARKKIQAIDKRRADYLKCCYNADWEDSRLYHLVINTSLMSMAQAVESIIATLHNQEIGWNGKRQVEKINNYEEGEYLWH